MSWKQKGTCHVNHGSDETVERGDSGQATTNLMWVLYHLLSLLEEKLLFCDSTNDYPSAGGQAELVLRAKLKLLSKINNTWM